MFLQLPPAISHLPTTSYHLPPPSNFASHLPSIPNLSTPTSHLSPATSHLTSYTHFTSSFHLTSHLTRTPHTYSHLSPLTSPHQLAVFSFIKPAIPYSLSAEFYMRKRSSQPAGIGANRPKTIVAAVSATTRRHSLAVPGPRAYAVRWPRGGVRHGAQRAAQAPIPALVGSLGSCLTSFRGKLWPGSALEASLRGYGRPSYRGRGVVTVAGVVGRAYHLLLCSTPLGPQSHFHFRRSFICRNAVHSRRG